MLRKKILEGILFTLLFSSLNAFDLSDFNSQAQDFQDLESALLSQRSGTEAWMNNGTPVNLYMDEWTFQFCTSYGSVMNPAFAYNEGPPLFQDYPSLKEGGEYLPVLDGQLMVGLGENSYALISGSYTPKMENSTSSLSQFSGGLNMGYRLYSEVLLGNVGVDLLVGYYYSSLESSGKNCTLNFSQASESAYFKGTLDMSKNSHTFLGQIMVTQNFALWLFYARCGATYSFGSLNTSLDGRGSGDSMASQDVQFQDSYSFDQWGLLTAGGFEAYLVFFYLNLEAGLDWLSTSMYGSIGVRVPL